MAINIEDEKREIIPEITKGPFIISLQTKETALESGKSGRFILGGPDNAEDLLYQALKDIDNLPIGLNWNQLRKEASNIFKQRGLSRVDF